MSVSNTTIKPDGLLTPVVGTWGEMKYSLVTTYAHMFTTAMHPKWGSLSYIDLFSGAGRAVVKPSRKLVLTTPTLALRLQQPFDDYIFCEIDGPKMSALRARVARDYPSLLVHYVPGDCNQNVQQIEGYLPTYSKGNTTLAFCVVDPFALRSLHFATIQSLAQRFMDFLVLIPAYMDAHRNQHMYLSKSDKSVDKFLGTTSWRAAWASTTGQGFGTFIADQFGVQMTGLGYNYIGVHDMVLVRHPKKNYPLYRLAFFSRHGLGQRFWQQAKITAQGQLPLFP